MICVQETHGSDTNLNLFDIDGYRWFGHNRKHGHKNAPHNFGGVGIYIKETLLNEFDCNIVDKSYEGILGVELTHKMTHRNVVIFCAYLPPENSPYGRDSTGFFSHILSKCYYYNNCDVFCLCGDLNARTGKLNDFVPDIDDLTPRTHLDDKVN